MTGLSISEVMDAVARVRGLGPVPASARIAPDVWSALRRDQDQDRPLLAPPPVLSIPVTVDDDLPPGGWRILMSDGSERSSDESHETLPPGEKR